MRLCGPNTPRCNRATGTLQVGKLADLVVAESNPFETPKNEISKIKVKAVMMDGEITAGSLD